MSVYYSRSGMGVVRLSADNHPNCNNLSLVHFEEVYAWLFVTCNTRLDLHHLVKVESTKPLSTAAKVISL